MQMFRKGVAGALDWLGIVIGGLWFMASLVVNTMVVMEGIGWGYLGGRSAFWSFQS